MPLPVSRVPNNFPLNLCPRVNEKSPPARTRRIIYTSFSLSLSLSLSPARCKDCIWKFLQSVGNKCTRLIESLRTENRVTRRREELREIRFERVQDGERGGEREREKRKKLHQWPAWHVSSFSFSFSLCGLWDFRCLVKVAWGKPREGAEEEDKKKWGESENSWDAVGTFGDRAMQLQSTERKWTRCRQEWPYVSADTLWA